MVTTTFAVTTRPVVLPLGTNCDGARRLRDGWRQVADDFESRADVLRFAVEHAHHISQEALADAVTRSQLDGENTLNGRRHGALSGPAYGYLVELRGPTPPR
jgi:hypothetical protein